MIKVITQVERQSGTQEKIEGKEMEYNNRVFTALGTLLYNLSRKFCKYVLRSPEIHVPGISRYKPRFGVATFPVHSFILVCASELRVNSVFSADQCSVYCRAHGRTYVQKRLLGQNCSQQSKNRGAKGQ